MKLKLDENLGMRGKHVLDAAGHDACTVAAQKLTAADDRHLIEICRLEGRALVTLDVDFAKPPGLSSSGLCRHCGHPAAETTDGSRSPGRT